MFCAVLTLPSGVVFIIPLGKVLVQEFGAEGSLVRWKFPAPHFRAVSDPASGWVWLWNPSLLCLCLGSLLVVIWEELIVLLVAQAFDIVTRQCPCELWVQASWNMYRCVFPKLENYWTLLGRYGEAVEMLLGCNLFSLSSVHIVWLSICICLSQFLSECSCDERSLEPSSSAFFCLCCSTTCCLALHLVSSLL